VTRMAGTPVNIVANGGAFVTGAACPAGTSLIGGEVDHNGIQVLMSESHQNTAGTAWEFFMVNNTAATQPVTAYSRCADTPKVF
jgi:hypothetical protein